MQPAFGSQPPVPTISAPAAPGNAFGVGRVIARTFSTWWRHVLVFSLLTLIAYVPLVATALLAGAGIPGLTAPSVNPLDPGAAAAAAPPTLPPGFWLAYLLTMLLFAVEIGAMTHGVIHHLAGKRVSLGGMLAAGVRRVVPLMVVGLLCYVIIVVGMILLVVPGVYFACALMAAAPAVVVERPGVFGAIKRSFALTKGKRFAIFVAFLVLFAVVLGATVFGSFVLPQLTASFSPMLGTLLGLAVNVVFGTLFWVAPAVVYHDLRVAKEGIATAQLAAIFE
jgi:hypothetical protein